MLRGRGAAAAGAAAFFKPAAAASSRRLQSTAHRPAARAAAAAQPEVESASPRWAGGSTAILALGFAGTSAAMGFLLLPSATAQQVGPPPKIAAAVALGVCPACAALNYLSLH